MVEWRHMAALPARMSDLSSRGFTGPKCRYDRRFALSGTASQSLDLALDAMSPRYDLAKIIL